MEMNENGVILEGFRMTELGPLPEEWEVINLNEVIDLRRGVSWQKKEANREGIGVPVIGIPNIKENGSIDFSDTYFLNKNISEEKILQINDILFVGSSGSIKNIGRNVLIREIPQNRFTYASFTFLGRVISMKVDNKYLFYLLNSPVVDFTKYARRSSDGKYNFQLTQFKNEQKIPLPPLLEQQKITAILSAVQEAKEKTEAVISATRDLKKSVMNYLFTYGPVPVVDAENVPLKETEVGMVPEEWEVVRLGDVAKISSGGSAPQGDEYFKGEKPFIRVSHIDNEDCIIKGYDLINDKAVQDYKLKLFPKGTIVFPKSGATIYLEKRVMLPTDAYVVSHLCTVIADEENVTQHFLFYLLRELKLAEEKADGYPTLNISEIKQIKIPLPPLSTQRKIASILSTIDQKIEVEENKKRALEDLFKTLLHNLMTARIRVNHLEVEI